MTPNQRFGVAVVVLTAGLVVLCGAMAAGKRRPVGEPTDFASRVDLSALENVAVHTDGRLKSFGSFAHERMGFVMGSRTIRGQSPAFTYLDLMFRPSAYADEPIVFVKNKNFRLDIRRAFEGSDLYRADPGRWDPRMDEFLQWGLVSEPVLATFEVQRRMEELERDLMRSARLVQAVRGALFVKESPNLAQSLRLVPPPGADAGEPWQALDFEGRPATPPRDADLGERLTSAWSDLVEGWVTQDAVAVDVAAARVADLLPRVEPSIYPDLEKLSWESWYFRTDNMTWVWMVYLLAVVFLLLHVVYRWRAAGRIGLGVFGVAFLLHSAALGLRWWVSGRWPNSNMFEAVTTSVWMGGCLAVMCEWVGRRSAMAKLYALTSAVASMVALMSAHFMPLQLNPNIGNMMPVLHDIWLYIHTNVIIWSYALIFMAAITGLLYLVHRLCGAQRQVLSMAGASMAQMEVAGGGASGGGAAGGGAVGSYHDASDPRGTLGAFDAAPDLGVVFDGVTMLLMKLSFVMLWAGLVMGAIWADHSWGRPWGWDPKETFALCTFLVFAVLVHVRWKARDKGLWTAVLAVVGALVMLFNWIVINFYISGLHSYA